MVISRENILKRVHENNLISNFVEDNLGPASYDISIGSKASLFKEDSSTIDLFNASSVKGVYEEIDISSGYELKPHESILVLVNEKINMPNDLCGEVLPRTSLNRIGLSINNQYLNPGYSGKLSMVLRNDLNNTNIKIVPNLKIGQILFFGLDEMVHSDYSYGKRGSSYMNEDDVNGSHIYNDAVGRVFRHYKGNYYYVISIDTDSEDLSEKVTYKALYGNNRTWVRPLKMFFEEIDPNKKDNITGQKHRFELATELIKDYTEDK